MGKECYVLLTKHIPFKIMAIRKDCNMVDIHLEHLYLSLHPDDAKQLAEKILKVVGK